MKKNSSKILPEKYEGKDNKIILGTYNEAPKYMQLNEYIKYGYRINCNSIYKSIKSLFVIHNESINIWSHLLGSILFIFLIYYTYKYITIYNIHLNYIRLNISEIKKYNQYLFNTDNYQIKAFVNNLFNYSKNFLNINNIKPKKLYIKTLENLNNTLISLRENNKNYTINFYFQRIYENLSHLKIYLFNLMEIQKKTNDEKILNSINVNIKKISIIYNVNFFNYLFKLEFNFHLLRNISNNYHKILSKFDYAGISILIAGSCNNLIIIFFIVL